MPVARYWVLEITASVAGGNIAIGGLEFRASVGGPALTGTPIFSVQQGGFPASNAFDGNSATAWASNNQIPAYIGLDLGGSPAEVAEFVLTAWTNFSFGNLTPKDFRLYFSGDGVNFFGAGRAPPQWKFTEPSWTAGQSRTYSYPLPANEEVYKVADSALMGAADKLMVGKIGDGALTGAGDKIAVGKVAGSALTGAGSRLAVGKIGDSALSGAMPYLSVGKIAMSVLIQPVLRPRNGPVQII